MGNKARTKDEQFIVKLYEEALKVDDLDHSFDRYWIGEKIGINLKAVDTICVLLAQANFIKKNGPVEVAITPNGIDLALTIMEG